MRGLLIKKYLMNLYCGLLFIMRLCVTKSQRNRNENGGKIVAASLSDFASITNNRWWHGYNSGKVTPEYCKEHGMFEGHRNLEKHNNHNYYRLWSKLNNTRNTKSLYGFDIALDAIWKNQHPRNCSSSKYLIASPHGWGFGSEIHAYGATLGLAMNMNRVLLQYPYAHRDLSWQVNSTHCGRYGQYSNLECYYEPWSSCTLSDALGPGWNRSHIEVLKELSLTTKELIFFTREIFLGKPGEVQTNGKAGADDIATLSPNVILPRRLASEAATVLRATNVHTYRLGFVPIALVDLVKCSPVHVNFYHYWWRAMSTAFLLRPNVQTLKWIDSQADSHVKISDKDFCVAAYVRRADKVATEMSLVPTARYVDTALQIFEAFSSAGLQRQNANATANSQGVVQEKRVLFLGTEENAVIEEVQQIVDRLGIAGRPGKNVRGGLGKDSPALPVRRDRDKKPREVPSARTRRSEKSRVLIVSEIELARNPKPRPLVPIRLEYTRLFDRDTQFARWGQQQNPRNASFGHDDQEYLSMLLNLQLAVRCDAWVCTLASNWCRVIDELRSTVGGKIFNPFADLSKESCRNPPCWGTGVYDLGW